MCSDKVLDHNYITDVLIRAKKRAEIRKRIRKEEDRIAKDLEDLIEIVEYLMGKE